MLHKVTMWSSNVSKTGFLLNRKSCRSYRPETKFFQVEDLLRKNQAPRSTRSNPSYYETTIDFKPSHVYKVVADIDRYSDFVPWCVESRVVEKINQKEMLADLTVGFPGIKEEIFRSHVTLRPFTSVTAIASADLYSKSPLKRLTNVWSFEQKGKNRTKVTMEIDFEFFDPIYTRMASIFMRQISRLAISRFVNRCEEVNEDMNNDIEEIIKDALVDKSFRGINDTIESLVTCTHFDREELEAIFQEFRVLTSSSSGHLTKDALGLWLGNPSWELLERVFLVMDVDHNGTLTLREFVRGVSLITRGSPREKRYFWFGNRADVSMTKDGLEEVILCTIVIRDALNRTLSSDLTYYPTCDKPLKEATRLVDPVFRLEVLNTKALERLFATM